ncbi:protein-glutamate O-methyltransferase [Geobacter sulfurreducens]|jgi:chemotaxis protein methyltransferase CheR|uniref:protein-glutamate O-methyltransferase n=1 Tax=Geobacter sulfurreducens (strain ATCC 51573 / DSM 12127 / PCA) TaxID=243231 RepID=Q74E21_GEOSL|nr:protein-glutamate O-methyltransferase [Geobacter sulfurreducens]AAR34519.2 protein glutamate methyltransferase CheR associated with MCPs of class 34H [Geobacter sulfurreducens PCA]ADI83980.1 protein glutamate methyltransferase CheR associated with MCPs of class 34H [Geobacter sulfurreducens KN400]AJY70865.1 chemotaxis protein CheR [Geobacter sulfurreducens]QVW36368.1 protein-glutamate O-methyltransferase [Geobacter sulfurreducens]UAC05183.1 protein-glutamate O-methyltransferase [Geobacter s
MFSAATDRITTAAMTDREFARFSEFIYDTCGIKMPPVKKTMLEARLQKRLRKLGISSFKDYSEYLFSRTGTETELVHLIDVVTTNKTDFFREPAHFDYLVSQALPELMERTGAGLRKPLSIWSAGCSSGEEPYTLAMVLSEFSEQQNISFSILATDICTTVLDKARLAVYDEERIDPVPMSLRRKYLLRGKGEQKGLVRVVPQLRHRITFRRLNFMDGDFGMREPMDIIFCRNVVIYFDKATQERLLNKFYRQLIPGGYLFMGHSETLSGLDVPFVQMASTVYRKPL